MAASPRPFAAIAALASTLLLTACLDQQCNFVAPSETVGSHTDDGKSADIAVRYGRVPGLIVTWSTPSQIDVTVSKIGNVPLGFGDRKVFLVENVSDGESFRVFLNGRDIGGCVLPNKKSVFDNDLSFLVYPGVTEGQFIATCGFANER